jgi:kynurenine formamidase
MHSGTHIDGPGHMLKNGYSLSQFPIDSFCGVGILIDARNKLLSCELLQKISISPGSIILILTGYDKHFRTGCYFADHPTISQDFAQVLISHNIKMVGFDMPGPDVEPFEVHKMFFQHNIMIIENLMGLDQLVNVKYFEVYALPLKIGTDSAPARVIAVY